MLNSSFIFGISKNVFIYLILFPNCFHLVPHQYVRWLRDDVLIVDSRHPDIPPPPRITLFNNGSLQVRDVNINDTAEYLCEVMTSTLALETQLHAIEVQCKCSIIIHVLHNSHSHTAHIE